MTTSTARPPAFALVAHTARSPLPYLLAALVIGLAVSITVSEIALGVIAGWLLVTRGASGTKAFAWPLLGCVSAFVIWTVIAALTSDHPLESLVAAKGTAWLAALYIVGTALADARDARRFVDALFLALSIVALLSIVQVAACPATGTSATTVPVLRGFLRKCARARGFYSIYMTLAGVLAMTLAATMPRLAVLTTSRTAWYALGWAVSLTALALTYVRGAWLGLAAAIALILALRRNYAVLATVAAVAAALVIVLPSVSHRVRTIGDPADPTTRERMAMIDTGLRLVRDHPITGIGPGQVKHAYPIFAPVEAVRRSTSHLHNTPLQIAVERGLPGLVLWLAVWAAFFVQAARIAAALPEGADRALVSGCIAAVAAFLVGGLFEYNFGDTEVLLVALALMAVPFVVQRAPAP